METGIAGRARFDRIRYAQVWEDAEVLLAALGPGGGRRFLSICSAGDNVLALLLLDPRAVVAADLAGAQLECLAVRLAALRVLDHGAFLEWMGARGAAVDRWGALGGSSAIFGCFGAGYCR